MPSVSRGVGPSRCIKEDCSLLPSSSTINSIRTIFTHCALCNAQCAFVSTYICTCKSIGKVKGSILYDQAHQQPTQFPPFSHTVHLTLTRVSISSWISESTPFAPFSQTVHPQIVSSSYYFETTYILCEVKGTKLINNFHRRCILIPHCVSLQVNRPAGQYYVE